MNRDIVIGKLKQIIYNFLQINISDENVNLFSTSFNISPVNMVYLLMELEQAFLITIDDRFIEILPDITINNLADAICICSK